MIRKGFLKAEDLFILNCFGIQVFVTRLSARMNILNNKKQEILFFARKFSIFPHYISARNVVVAGLSVRGFASIDPIVVDVDGLRQEVHSCLERN